MTTAEQSHELAEHDPRDHRTLRRYVTTWDGETHTRTLASIQDDMTYAAFTGEYPWDRACTPSPQAGASSRCDPSR
jgi:hypothetical protein